MKLLFAHDNRFIPLGARVYSDTHFEASVWERYLELFSSVMVAGRRETAPDGTVPEQLVLSSRPGVSFDLFPNISTFRGLVADRRKAKEKMARAVADADAVIARLPSELGILAARCAMQQGKPWAVEVVGCAWDGLWNHGSWQGRAYAPVLIHRMRRVVRKAPFALYVTASFLQNRYPTDGFTTHASNVRLHEHSPRVLENRLRRISTMDGRPVRLGLIGTLRTRIKGIHTVLEALAKTRDRLPPLTFHVLGGGDSSGWEAEAEARGVSDIVTFEGTRPPGPPVLTWLDGIDLYLQPSLQEGLPRALIEAMSRGCPAIGSRCAGIPELLDPADIIRPGSAGQLAAALTKRIGDRGWMENRARRNWEEAGQYEVTALTERRHRFLSALAGHAEAQRNPSAGLATR